jgi:hypothetical protein
MSYNQEMVDENKVILARAKKILADGGYNYTDELDHLRNGTNAYTRKHFADTLESLQAEAEFHAVSKNRLSNATTRALRQLRGE